MNKVYDPGDVKILGIKLTNYNGSATRDIRGQILSCSIYEDMEQPSIFAELLLRDGVNLVKDFPILGEEMLEISFITPGRDQISTFKLRVFSIKGTGTDPSAKASTYTLQAVSPDHFVNAINLVEKSYNTTVDKIVLDIIKTTLESSKKALVESTRGIVPITLPRMTGFKAIDYLRQKAISKLPSGGVFVFYENQYGYNFTSIEKLIEDGKKTVGSKIFTHQPGTSSDSSRQAYAFRNVIQLQQLSKFDTIDKLNAGVYKNVSKSYDMLTKTFGETNFNITDHISKFKFSDNVATIPNSKSLTNQALQGSPTYIFSPIDSSKGNDYVADLLGYRQAYTFLFNQVVTRCMIYGDNYLSVGDLIELKLPDTSGTTNKKVDDARYSGNYLITKLRHILVQEDKKFKHHITFDCNRVGIGG